jgi:putative FmdB family regulatory protein
MPFYEYECSNCGHRDEVLQGINDKPLKKCPSCGKSALKKLISAPVFRLKGSGWYETDFKSDKENKRNLAGADKEDAKSESKSDAKPDVKPEAAKGDASKSETAKPDSSKPESSKSESAKPKPVKSKAKAKTKARKGAR